MRGGDRGRFGGDRGGFSCGYNGGGRGAPGGGANGGGRGNFNSRGCGNHGGGNYGEQRTRCQLCNVSGHVVKDCWYRYDEDFIPK